MVDSGCGLRNVDLARQGLYTSQDPDARPILSDVCIALQHASSATTVKQSPNSVVLSYR